MWVELSPEGQRRLVAGAMARAFGRGGPTRVAEASGLSRDTVITGAREMAAGAGPSDRVRAPGAGRRFLIDEQPGLLQELDNLVEPESRGDPMSPLRWTAKSTENLARALVAKGYRISADTVGRLLKAMDYSLQRTETTSGQAGIFQALGVAEPKRFLDIVPASHSASA